MEKLHTVEIYGKMEQNKEELIYRIENLMNPSDLTMLKGIYCISELHLEDKEIPGIWIREYDDPLEFIIDGDQLQVNDFPIIIIDRDLTIENFAFVLLHEIGHHKNEFLDGKERYDIKEKEINAHLYALNLFNRLEGISTEINNLLYLEDAIMILN
jgi:hypothetical protein